MAPFLAEAIDAAERHLRDVLAIAFEHALPRSAVVVFDTRCDLAIALTEAYRRCLPDATFIDFDAVSPETVAGAFVPLADSDLVVLIQSTNFRLDAYRIRVELFKRDLKAIALPPLQPIRFRHLLPGSGLLPLGLMPRRRLPRQFRAISPCENSAKNRLILESFIAPWKLR